MFQGDACEVPSHPLEEAPPQRGGRGGGKEEVAKEGGMGGEVSSQGLGQQRGVTIATDTADAA